MGKHQSRRYLIDIDFVILHGRSSVISQLVEQRAERRFKDSATFALFGPLPRVVLARAEHSNFTFPVSTRVTRTHLT